jgi:hypothetical protein
MNPYRIDSEKEAAADKPPVCEDDGVVAWVWLVAGAVLIMTDVGQPGPWGAWSSLGMLISGLAIVALYWHYVARWRRT